jgi:hypothetical protein
MTKQELKIRLDELCINPDNYSLEGDFKSDAIILQDLTIIWEVFYLDAKGGRNQEKKFNSETEACIYIYKQFLVLLKLRGNLESKL